MSGEKKKRNFFPKKEIVKQLDILQQHGMPLHYEKDVPLSANDIAHIKKLFQKVLYTFLLLSISVIIVLLNFYKEEIVMIIGVGLLLFFAYAIIRGAYQVYTNLRIGKKTVIRGIITDRFIKKEYSDRDEDGKRTAIDRHYLKIGDYEMTVNPTIYAQHKTGEAIELQVIYNLTNKPYFLVHEKLSDAGLTHQ